MWSRRALALIETWSLTVVGLRSLSLVIDEYNLSCRTQSVIQMGAMVIEAAVEQGFTDGELRPMEFGGTMGTDAMTRAVLNRTGQKGGR